MIFREKLVTVIWPKLTCQVQVTRVQTLPLRDAFLLPHARRVLMASSPTDVGWHAAMRVHRSINLDQTKAAGHLSRPGIWSYSLSLYRSTLELILNYGVRDIYISKYPSPSIYQSKSLCLSVAFSLSLSVFLPACLNDWLTGLIERRTKGTKQRRNNLGTNNNRTTVWNLEK